MRNFLIFGLMGLLITCIFSCSPPGGRIAANSNTAECQQNISKGLQSLASGLGLPISISIADAKQIIETGELAKSYGRDGMGYTAYFGLNAETEGCKLMVYRLDKKGPGENTSNYSDYGAVELEACNCK